MVYVLGFVVYSIMFIPITIATSAISEVDTESRFFRRLFQRDTHYTTYFSFGKLVLWMLLLVAGFTYVPMVTMKNRVRRNVFLSRYNNYKHITILVLVGPILYFIAPIIFLRDSFDMQKGCVDPPLHPATHIQKSLNIFEGTQLEHLENLIKLPLAYYDLVKPHSHCVEFSMWHVFAYNYTFVLVFFFALNYSHLQKIPLDHLSLSAEDLKKWGWKQYVLIFSVLIVVLANLAITLIMYYNAGILFPYLGMIFGFIFFLVVIS